MAWLVTRLWRALHVNGAVGGRVINTAKIGSNGSCLYTTCFIAGCSFLVINGNAPGVLFQVWRWWICRVFLRCRFAMGLCECMIGGAFIILGMVTIGVSSITLCCLSCSIILTLYSSSCSIDGFKMLVMLDWSCLISTQPWGVWAAFLFHQQVCWSVHVSVVYASNLEVGNVVGITWLIMRFCMLKLWVCSTAHTCSDIWMVQGTIHKLLLLPTNHVCHNLCKLLL